jgi:hypothetical protein
MRYQDAIKKINKLLGLYKFNSYKLKTGEEFIISGDLAVGEPIYVITNDGQLPAPEGEYELEDTTKIKIEDGKIQEIKYDMEKKTEMTDAMLKDGTVIKSPTFDVGEDAMIVDADGNETKAPDGEHEVKLMDAEGKEVLIKIITKDGKITERENVELPEAEAKEVEEEMGVDYGLTPDLSDVNDAVEEDFKKNIMEKIDAMMGKIEEMANDYKEVKAKVAKFSKEPAGQPIKQPKNALSDIQYAKNDMFAQLVKIRANTLQKK